MEPNEVLLTPGEREEIVAKIFTSPFGGVENAYVDAGVLAAQQKLQRKYEECGYWALVWHPITEENRTMWCIPAEDWAEIRQIIEESNGKIHVFADNSRSR